LQGEFDSASVEQEARVPFKSNTCWIENIMQRPNLNIIIKYYDKLTETNDTSFEILMKF